MLDPDIHAMQEAERKLLADDESRYKYEQYKKSLKDWNSSIVEAEKRGEVRGEVRGEAKATAKLACNLLSKDLSIQLIHEYTGLLINKIEALQQQLAQA